MKRTFAITALMFGVLASSVALAQIGEAPGHEVWFGLGGASSSEKHVFNIPNIPDSQPDPASQPDLAITFGYMYNLDPRWAVGFHVYGTTETLPRLVLYDEFGNPVATEFTLSTYNLGLRGRYTFMRGPVAPYAYAGVNYAFGSVESDEMGRLRYSGSSFVVGPGASLRLGSMWQLSAEGVFSFGSAKWSQLPFPDASTSEDFDPGLAGGLVNVAFVWGEQGSR